MKEKERERIDWLLLGGMHEERCLRLFFVGFYRVFSSFFVSLAYLNSLINLRPVSLFLCYKSSLKPPGASLCPCLRACL